MITRTEIMLTERPRGQPYNSRPPCPCTPVLASSHPFRALTSALHPTQPHPSYAPSWCRAYHEADPLSTESESDISLIELDGNLSVRLSSHRRRIHMCAGDPHEGMLTPLRGLGYWHTGGAKTKHKLTHFRPLVHSPNQRCSTHYSF